MRVWLAALSLVVLGSLAGCGDDGDDPKARVTVTQTVTETPTPTPTESTTLPPETETTEPTEPTETTPPAVDLSQPPTTYDEAAAHIAAGGDAQELGTFQSADEKFYCAFDERFIRPSCEILDSIQDPETCADSPSPGVGRIELTRRGWAPFCNTDTIRQPGAAVLAADGVASWPDESIECVLEGVGLTCVKTDSGQGFYLGPGRYQVF
jgi:hypothetical protein